MNHFKFNLQETIKLLYSYSKEDNFAIRLNKVLIRNDITIKELSKLLKITESGIRNYIYGSAYPSPKIILALYNILGRKIICDEYIEFISSGSSDRFKTWRKKNGLTKKAAAKILGISQNAYLGWENNKTYITQNTFYKIKDKITL